MIRFLKAALQGVRNELAAGESGWVDAGAAGAVSSAGYTSAAGQTVSGLSALKISAAWGCVRKTAELVSTLPLDLFEKQTTGGRERLENGLSDVLTIRPNSLQTAQEFWEGMVAQMVLQGNAYAEILRVGKEIVGLRPLLGCTARRLASGKLEYTVLDRGQRYKMDPAKVFHLRGFGAGDGLGLSAIKFGANSMGAALAADETAGSIFSNGMMAAGVLTTEQVLNAEQRGQLGDMLKGYIGSKRAGKVLTLEAGLNFKQLQMNPEDAQLLDTRRFNVEDVCRWFGVPPIIIGHAAEGQTMWGSGVEAIMLSWLTLGINPLLKRIEARILADLVPVERRRRWLAEFNREAMLQMDSAAKAAFLGVMANTATMTANERREKLNLPRHKDQNADELLAQGAMVLLPNLGKEGTNGQG